MFMFADVEVGYLKYLDQKKFNLKDVNIMHTAAAHGNVECVRFLRARGCAWNAQTSGAAAEEGHLDCLAFLVTNGCKVLSRFSFLFFPLFS